MCACNSEGGMGQRKGASTLIVYCTDSRIHFCIFNHSKISMCLQISGILTRTDSIFLVVHRRVHFYAIKHGTSILLFSAHEQDKVNKVTVWAPVPLAGTCVQSQWSPFTAGLLTAEKCDF